MICLDFRGLRIFFEPGNEMFWTGPGQLWGNNQSTLHIAPLLTSSSYETRDTELLVTNERHGDTELFAWKMMLTDEWVFSFSRVKVNVGCCKIYTKYQEWLMLVKWTVVLRMKNVLLTPSLSRIPCFIPPHTASHLCWRMMDLVNIHRYITAQSQQQFCPKTFWHKQK